MSKKLTGSIQGLQCEYNQGTYNQGTRQNRQSDLQIFCRGRKMEKQTKRNVFYKNKIK